MGKRAHRGGRSEWARDKRAWAREAHNQEVRDRPGHPVPTQGPEARKERARPSVAPGYQSPASAAAAADAEFPEDWPPYGRAESPVAEPGPAASAATAADAAADAGSTEDWLQAEFPEEENANFAAAPWRRAAGPQAEPAPARAAEPPPQEQADESSESESSHGSDPIPLLEHYENCVKLYRAQGDLELAARYEGYAAEERRLCGLGGSDDESSEPPAAGYEVSLSSEGELSTSTPRESRSRSRSPDTPEVYREFDRDDREFDREFERLEICSLEFSQDGGAGSSSGGAAEGHGGASSSSRAGARPAARSRGRRPPWVRPWKADRGAR